MIALRKNTTLNKVLKQAGERPSACFLLLFEKINLFILTGYYGLRATPRLGFGFYRGSENKFVHHAYDLLSLEKNT
ncbi:hypothetical protein [Bacillus sp. Marseille-Q3570]|uniref:hypothetical protein n=1 Tax=Bacillus sp. Marseille-Q3570 TaxID=2963522 RepID=UPI0021B6EE1F|nr:hypothetical protein [Bacillus sp. Marseille-Q3570]